MVDRQLFSTQFYVNSIIGITAHTWITPNTRLKLSEIKYTIYSPRHTYGINELSEHRIQRNARWNDKLNNANRFLKEMSFVNLLN